MSTCDDLLRRILCLPEKEQWDILAKLIKSLEEEGIYMTTHSLRDHDRVVKIVLDDDDAKIPVYAKRGDAGADVYAVSNDCFGGPTDAAGHMELGEKEELIAGETGDYLIRPNSTAVIDLGLRIQLRPGWEMQVRSRSGLAKRGLVVVNSPGTIDSGYRGPCMVLLRNLSSVPRIIKPGTRVAQFVLKRAPQAIFEQVDTLDESDRGEGGFGSTGTQ